MRKKKFNEELLKEEIKKFKLINEYGFFKEEEPEEKPLILGVSEADEDEGSDPFGEEIPEDEESTGDEEVGFGDEESTDDEEVGFGDEMPDDEESTDDSVELDVTELVKGSEEAKASSEDAKASADAANSKIEQLMGMVGKLESQLSSMDKISDKIDSLESELEKRAPTEQEKLEMRSLDSAPYNLKLTDFWKDKEGVYDVMGDEKEKEYTLTNDDIENDYSEEDIKSSFDDNEFEKDEF